MGSTDTNLEHNKVKLGPLTIEGSLGPALAAERFEAFSPGGQAAIAWRWPSESLDRLSIPSFAQLIDAMQDVEVAGVAKLLHGSVATEHAVIAFTRPRGSSIKDYLLRGKTSPLETLNSRTDTHRCARGTAQVRPARGVVDPLKLVGERGRGSMDAGCSLPDEYSAEPRRVEPRRGRLSRSRGRPCTGALST